MRRVSFMLAWCSSDVKEHAFLACGKALMLCLFLDDVKSWLIKSVQLCPLRFYHLDGKGHEGMKKRSFREIANTSDGASRRCVNQEWHHVLWSETGIEIWQSIAPTPTNH